MPPLVEDQNNNHSSPEFGEQQIKARLRDLEEEGNQIAISAMSSREALIYIPVYKHLGISENQSAELMKQRERIHEASQEVNSSLIKLATNRREYDESVRKILSTDKYSEYKQYEETKPVRMEVERIKEYLATNGTSLGQNEQVTLEAVDQTKAILFEQTHGPYDKNPEIKVGVEENIAHWKSEIARLTGASSQLVDALSPKIPAESLAPIKSYYQTQINNLKNNIDFLTKQRASANARMESNFRGEMPPQP